MRLSQFLASKYSISRKFAKRMLAEGQVTAISGNSIICSDIDVRTGDDYLLNMVMPEIAFNVDDYLLYDDGDYIFFHKPPNMHTERNTPLDKLCLSDIVDSNYPQHKLISRLDYGVDGIVVAVRGNISIKHEQKTYLAWVNGIFPENEAGCWLVDADKRKKVKVYADCTGDRMDFKRLCTADDYSLIEVTLEHAHRHQVRAVCAAMGHPIVGDALYGYADVAGDRILLHCFEITINEITRKSNRHSEFRALK